MHVGFRVTDAGEVRNRIALGVLFEANHQIVGSLPGGAARSVGHRNKGGTQLRKLLDGLIEEFGCFVVLRREKFEAEGGAMSIENISNVHDLLFQCFLNGGSLRASRVRPDSFA